MAYYIHHQSFFHISSKCLHAGIKQWVRYVSCLLLAGPEHSDWVGGQNTQHYQVRRKCRWSRFVKSNLVCQYFALYMQYVYIASYTRLIVFSLLLYRELQAKYSSLVSQQDAAHRGSVADQGEAGSTVPSPLDLNTLTRVRTHHSVKSCIGSCMHE